MSEMMTAKSTINPIYKIKEGITQLYCVFGIIVLFTIAGCINIRVMASLMQGYWQNPGDADIILWIFGISNLTLIIMTFRTKAVWNGVVLNIEDRTMIFPGGNTEANDIIDYVKPSFLLQYFHRHTIDLDKVSNISNVVHTSRISDKHGNIQTNYGYEVMFSGPFGASSVFFTKQGKANELYAALRQVNKMGEPIVFA